MSITPTPLSRRRFLQGISVAVGAAALSREILDSRPKTAFAISGATLPPGTPVVVVIDLAGGADLMNAVIPYNVPGVSNYYQAGRPNIGIKQFTNVVPYTAAPLGNYLPPGLDIDGQYAFHGALPFLANRWHTNHDVAVVHGTGEDVVQEMSHFASFSYRWAGAFSGNLMNTGWMGRYNDLQGNLQPLGAVSLGGVNQGLVGNTSLPVVINDLASFSFYSMNVPDQTLWRQQLANLGDPASPGANKIAVAAKAINNAELAVATAAGIPSLPVPSNAGQLGAQLAVAASLISAGIPCQTYTATLGGFDDHAGEPYALWDRLDALNSALAAFFALIDASSRAGDVFVMLHSEFGRQVSENAGLGTDHGRASSTILVGGGVQGGMYGTYPNIAPSARYYDAMVPTTDFRAVYATVLNRLGGNLSLTDSALGKDESGHAFSDLGVFTVPTGGSTTTTTTTTAPGATTTTAAATTTTTAPTTTAPTTTTLPAGSIPVPKFAVTSPSTGSISVSNASQPGYKYAVYLNGKLIFAGLGPTGTLTANNRPTGTTFAVTMATVVNGIPGPQTSPQYVTVA